jgi:MFS family permease
VPIDANAENARPRLSPNVVALGFVSMLTAISSSMIYGLLPVFLVRILGASVAAVGLIEGLAEAASSVVKIASGAVSDWIGRRKPIVVWGYALSAIVKTVFPLATGPSAVLAARIIDRLGKGVRDAPRDAFLADLAPPEIRGASFGLRLALAITGFVVGPLIAVLLMSVRGDDFRLVFWIALIPAYLSIMVLVVAVREVPPHRSKFRRGFPICRRSLTALPVVYWWVITLAGIVSLARFSQAFVVLKAHDVGTNVALLPLILVVMHLVYSVFAYPCGLLADRVDRRIQIGIGIVVLIAADVVLSSANTAWMMVLGAALWGLQFGVTQGLFGAIIADVSPDGIRGVAFGIYDIVVGVGAFIASAVVGVLWTIGGSAIAFSFSACVAAGAIPMLIFRSLPQVPKGAR